MHKLFLKFKLFLIIISMYCYSNLFSWQVTIHNNSNQTINAELHTTQNYPCGHWYKIKWCNCGKTIEVEPKNSSTYNYKSTNKICVDPCTSSIIIYDSNGNKVVDQSKLAGGLTACSNIEVWVGQGSDGVWYMYTNDWANNFQNWLNQQIVPALEQIATAGFNINNLIPEALDAAKDGEKIGHKINSLTSNIGTSVTTIKNIADQINSITSQIQYFLNTSKINPNELKTNFQDLISGNYLKAIAEFLGQFEQLNISITQAVQLLTNIKTTNDNIVTQIDNVDLKPLILSISNLVSIIQNLVKNIAGIINDIPETILNHKVVSPMENIQEDLSKINDNINELLNIPPYNANQIESNLINGIFSNMDNITITINKVNELIDSIIVDVKELSNTVIPELQNNIKSVTTLISSIKDRILNELKTPENIALMTPAIMAALPGAIFSFASFGTSLPLIIPAVSLAAQPLIKSITINLLKEAQIDTLVYNISNLVKTLTDATNKIITIINTFKTEIDVNLLTDQSYEIINNLDELLNKTNIDLTNLNNEIPSLI